MRILIDTIKGNIQTDTILDRENLDLAFILLEFAESQLNVQELRKDFYSLRNENAKKLDIDWDKLVADFNNSQK